MDKLDYLLSGIHTSIVAAHQLASQQHILEIQKHLEGDGKTLKILELELKDNGSKIRIQVPEISLVPPRSLAIEKVVVKMKLLIDVDGGQDGDGKERRGSRFIARLLGTNDERRDDAVELTVEFKGDQPPEGVMKVREILDQTIKVNKV
jgi:hypothetical protein